MIDWQLALKTGNKYAYYLLLLGVALLLLEYFYLKGRAKFLMFNFARIIVGLAAFLIWAPLLLNESGAIVIRIIESLFVGWITYISLYSFYVLIRALYDHKYAEKKQKEHEVWRKKMRESSKFEW